MHYSEERTYHGQYEKLNGSPLVDKYKSSLDNNLWVSSRGNAAAGAGTFDRME